MLIVLFQRNIYHAPDYLYSIYICDLSPLRFAVVEQIAVRFSFISHSNGLGSVRTAQAIRSKKLSSVRTARATPSNRSNGLSARLLFQNNSPEQFATNRSQNVSVVYHHLANCHGTFSAQSIFSFITFDYRYRFYSRLSYKIQQLSRTSQVLTFL